jgi:hypothetical protein
MKSIGSAGLVGLLVAMGCSSSMLEDDDTAQQSAALSNLAAPTQINEFVVIAGVRSTFQDRAVVTGGHIGVASGSGDSLTAGFDSRLAVGKSTLAQRTVLKDRANVGDLFATTVVGSNGRFTSLSPYAAPPAAPALAAFTAGSTAVTVSSPRTLAAGDYGVVTVNSTLTLSGGTYEIQNLVLGPNAVVQSSAATLLRIAGRITGNNNNRIGPTGTQPAGNLRIVVAGANDTTGGVVLGNDARLTALVLSRASFRSGDRFVGSGAIAASNVTMGFDTRYAFASGFQCNSDAGCNDGNACSTDACVDGQCVSAAVSNGTACAADASECTADQCQAGVCAHPALPNGTACAADASECTTDQCQAGACAHPAVADGTACAADASECTTDQCQAGACAHPAVADGTECTADANECTTDVCGAGSCVHPAVPNCPPVDPSPEPTVTPTGTTPFPPAPIGDAGADAGGDAGPDASPGTAPSTSDAGDAGDAG